MSARLKCMARGQEYRFICDVDMARRMDRVVSLAGGIIQAQDDSTAGVVVRLMTAE